MTFDPFGVGVILLLISAPFLIDWYLRRLPVAPACPSCRWVTRELGHPSVFLAWIPAFTRTFVAECGRCGWHGRMRWTFAPEPRRRGG